MIQIVNYDATYMDQVGLMNQMLNTRWQEMIDAEKILLDDYAYIPVFEKGAATLQNPKVKNLVIKPCRTISFEYVEKTELKEKRHNNGILCLFLIKNYHINKLIYCIVYKYAK